MGSGNSITKLYAFNGRLSKKGISSVESENWEPASEHEFHSEINRDDLNKFDSGSTSEIQDSQTFGFHHDFFYPWENLSSKRSG